LSEKEIFVLQVVFGSSATNVLKFIEVSFLGLAVSTNRGVIHCAKV